MKTANRAFQIIFLLGLLILLGWGTAGRIEAATNFVWNTDGDGNWTDTTKWNPSAGSGIYPQNAGDIASLTSNITADRTVTLNQSVTLGALNLKDGPDASNPAPWYSWIIAQGGGGQITFDTAGGGAAPFTIGGTDAGNHGVIGSNNLVNVPIVLNDDLQMNIYGRIDLSAPNPRTILTLGGMISDGSNGSKSVTLQGMHGGGKPYVYLASSNSFSGGLTVNNPVSVFAQADGALGSGPVSFTGAAGTITFDTAATHNLPNDVSGGGYLFLAGARTLDLSGNNISWTGTLSVQSQSGGAINLSNANAMTNATLMLYGSSSTIAPVGGNRTVSNLVHNGSSSSLVVAPGGDLTFHAMSGATSIGLNLTVSNATTTIKNIASGFNTLSKGGPGTLVLSGNNSYPGSVSLGAGKLVLDSNSALGAGGASLTLSAGATITTSASRIFTNGLYTSFQNNPYYVDLANGFDLTMDKFTVFNANGQSLRLTVLGPGTLTLSNGVVQSANNSGLNKQGSGTLVLGGTSSYALATTVGAGKLLVNGVLSTPGGSVTVSNAATLGGSGVINRGTTILTGGILAPGASAGTLTLTNLTMQTGTIYDWEVGPGSVYDSVNITSNGNSLTFGAGLKTLNLSYLSPASASTNDQFVLFQYTSGQTDDATFINSATNWSLQFFGDRWITDNPRVFVDVNANQVLLSGVGLIPEPSMLLLLGLGGLILRRKRLE